MSKNESVFDKIRVWADERGLYEKGDMKTQYCKLGEEFGELGRAIIKNDQEELIDAIGDMVVVLTNLTKLAGDHFEAECEVCVDGLQEDGEPCDTCATGLKIEECIDIAYDVIKDRKGSMKGGSFVKQ